MLRRYETTENIVAFCTKKTKQDKENPTLGIFEIKASGIPASFYGRIKCEEKE